MKILNLLFLAGCVSKSIGRESRTISSLSTIRLMTTNNTMNESSKRFLLGLFNRNPMNKGHISCSGFLGSFEKVQGIAETDTIILFVDKEASMLSPDENLSPARNLFCVMETDNKNILWESSCNKVYYITSDELLTNDTKKTQISSALLKELSQVCQ